MGAWSIHRREFLWVASAILCAAGIWLYAGRVIIPSQRAYAAAHGFSHGNHSDLYPRWFGARELLLHGRDPYTMQMTAEIQEGFYGRVLPPDAPGKAQNFQQGFYYPVYVAFLLAPTFHLPFEIVQKIFLGILVALTVATVPLWLYALRWRPPLWVQLTILGFMLGSLPIMQGLKLQQMTLLVVPLLAGAMALLVANHPILAGALLALATIKPQLVWLVLLWLLIWTAADWRSRYSWLSSFVVSMTILCAASAWYLPSWMLRFWEAMREYHNYTGEMSVTQLEIGFPASRVVELIALAIVAGICWRQRRRPANSEAFAFCLSLVLAATILVVPSYGPYNQALLLPAILIMLKERRAIWARSTANRVLCMIVIGLFCWQWLWCMVLAALSFVLPMAAVERGLHLPLWTILLSPLGVAGAMLSCGLQRTFAAYETAAPS